MSSGEDMENFNERTKKYIDEIAPNLFNEISEKQYKGEKFYYFVVNGNGKEIILSSENEEYSVFYSTFHCHFTPDLGPNEKQTLEEAIIFIKDIIQEKIAIVAYFHNDRLTMGTYIDFNEEPEFRANRRIEIESWKDTYTRMIPAQVINK